MNKNKFLLLMLMGNAYAQAPHDSLVNSPKTKRMIRTPAAKEDEPLVLMTLRDPKGAVQDWKLFLPQKNWLALAADVDKANEGKEERRSLFSLVETKKPPLTKDFVKVLVYISFCLEGEDAGNAGQMYLDFLSSNPALVMEATNEALSDLNANPEMARTSGKRACVRDLPESNFTANAFDDFATFLGSALAEFPKKKATGKVSAASASFDAWRKALSTESAKPLAPLLESIDQNRELIFSLRH